MAKVSSHYFINIGKLKEYDYCDRFFFINFYIFLFQLNPAMTSFAKNLFGFSQSTDKDLQIANKITKIDGLVKDLEKDKHIELPNRIKAILNLALREQKGDSLFELVYKSASKQSLVEWVPVMGRVINLLSSGSQFMRIVLSAQDYKIPIERTFIPDYLFKNNLLNQKTGYQNISNSIGGMTVPLLDYVFIRLLHGLWAVNFIEMHKNPNEQYEGDDFFFYMSRNPYILLLKNYFDFFVRSDKNLVKLVGNLKMYFVDGLLIKHRINKLTSVLRDISLSSSKYRIKPHHLLVIFLLLQRQKSLFEQKHLYFNELIQRFSSIVEVQNEIYFRFLLRVFNFAYAGKSVENKVIDSLRKANPQDGFFELARYSSEEFSDSIRIQDRKQRTDFNANKTLLLKLLEKDSNLLSSSGKINFATMRNLSCFLQLQINLNPQSGPTKQNPEDIHRINSEASSLELGIQKIYRFVRTYLAKESGKKLRDFTKQNEEKLMQQLEKLLDLFFRAYGRKIDLRKFEDIKQTNLDRSFNVRGVSEDYSFSVETYKKDIDENCWKVPLKDSEYHILYDFFYWLACLIDRMIPGQNKTGEPRVNLRYLCNPIVFMLVMVVLVFVLKFVF